MAAIEVKGMELVTKAKFSRLAGVSAAAITKAIRAGKITTYEYQGKEFIDKLTQLETYKSTCKKGVQDEGQTSLIHNDLTSTSGSETEQISLEDSLTGDDGIELPPELKALLDRMPNSAEVNRIIKFLDMEARRLKLEKEEGKLVSLDDVLQKWEEVGIVTRKALMNIPERVALSIRSEILKEANQNNAIPDSLSATIIELATQHKIKEIVKKQVIQVLDDFQLVLNDVVENSGDESAVEAA